MQTFYRNLISIIINGWSWILDYLYIAYWQTIGLFIHSNPSMFQSAKSRASKPSIILIPGIYEPWRIMRPVARLLFNNDYDVHVIEGLGYNVGTVEEMANIANKYIRKQKIKSGIIVAHSKGGLIGKYMLMNLNENAIIKGMVALNAPFSGSKYAYFAPFRSLRSFSPTSHISKVLAANRLVNERIVSIYGLFDPHVPGGSRLEGARNIQLRTRGHHRTLSDPTVHEAILNSLKVLEEVT